MPPPSHSEHRPDHELAELPYQAGWLDRLINFIDRLPGSNTAWCALLMLVEGAWVLGALWSSGRVRVGVVPWPLLFSVVIIPGLLRVRFHLDRVAAACMDRFRPMLPVEDEEFERLRYELTTLSARTTNLVTLVALAAVIVNGMVAPESWSKLWGGTLEAAWRIGPVMVPTMAVAAVSLAMAINQLGMVDRIHQVAGPIDIRRAKPLHAFSRLTALTGMSFLLLASYIMAVRFDLVESLPAVGFVTLSMIPIAIACFFLPLHGMHRRLVEAKDRAISQVEDRMEAVFARIHERVEQGRVDDAASLKSQLDSLKIELDGLKSISAWPWETSTLTGFLTTLVLPLLIWLLQRGIERSGF